MQTTKKNIKYQPLEAQEGPHRSFPFLQPKDSNQEWVCPLMGVIHLQSNMTLGPKVLMQIGPAGLPIGSQVHPFYRVAAALRFSIGS